MSNETSKCRRWRQAVGHFEKYLHGNGIDIGAGADPLVVDRGRVRAWDMADGDAQLMAGVTDRSFDFVYSSHCLEHMRDVPESIRNWRRILKPGGWLYIVVPDYQFYEKLTWPSRYNPDHKQTFSYMWPDRATVGRANHWTYVELSELMSGRANGLTASGMQYDRFDFDRGLEDQTAGHALSQLYFVARK